MTTENDKVLCHTPFCGLGKSRLRVEGRESGGPLVSPSGAEKATDVLRLVELPLPSQTGLCYATEFVHYGWPMADGRSA